eukprot:SAG31_NODE_24977_length_470_cov_1.212938_2_plen_86_part_00
MEYGLPVLLPGYSHAILAGDCVNSDVDTAVVQAVLEQCGTVAAATRKLETMAVESSASSPGKKLLSRFCAHYQRNTGLLSRDVTH